MKENIPQEKPYKNLGERLKTVRQGLKESIAEASGAVEIDENDLQQIENGQIRPSEDILLLLITHFGVQDDEAIVLWDLAGYDHPTHAKGDKETGNNRPLVMVMAVDSRIIYSDKAEVIANPNGVIVNFFQAPNGPYQPQTVARIGMSREQADTFSRILQQTLVQSTKNSLPRNQASSETKNNPKTDAHQDS